ncbi:MAG TPA: 30S ribosomal protein S16 [Candidatus Limnocylindria bacterium]|nr:30S ribosomal protein S16 [Candidatus Limnocylindria bacterium]
MAVAIRLTRVGATKRPAYRVIAIDKRRSRDGRAIEILGYYDPLTDPATVQLDTDKIKAWIGNGAQPSDMVVRLMRQVERAAQGEEKPRSAPKRKPSKKAQAKAAEAKAAPAAAPEQADSAAEPVAEAVEEAPEATVEAEAAAEPQAPEPEEPEPASADEAPATKEAPATEGAPDATDDAEKAEA